MIYCVILSWGTKFSNLGIKDIEEISKNRVYKKIRMYPKIGKRLIEEKIMQNGTSCTKIF